MRLIRTVVVKHVLTDKKKSQIIQQFEEELIRNKREFEQLTFQLHKTLRDSHEHDHSKIKARYHKDLSVREEKLKSISFQLEQVETLQVGMELQEEKVRSIVDIKVGDPWPSTDQLAEIIVKDGIILEIREGRYDDDGVV
jgi:stress response protein YsnF